MRGFVIALLTGAWFCMVHAADDPASLCVDGASCQVIYTKEVISLDQGEVTQMPHLEMDGHFRWRALHWQPLPKEVTAKVEKMDSYKGRAIYQVTYEGIDDKASHMPFTMVMFAYEVAARHDKRARPFFVLSGDQIRWCEAKFESEKQKQPTLLIRITAQGNGVYWTNYSFGFTTDGVRLSERGEGGRGMNTKFYYYNKAGQVSSVETLNGN